MYAFQIAQELSGVFDTVVYSAQEDVFYGYPVAGNLLIFLKGLSQISKGKCFVDWHEAASEGIFGCMQRDSEAHSEP